MNKVEDLDHALIIGVLMGTLRRSNINVDVLLNEEGEPTPYLHINLDGNVKALVVVMPPD
jgi:hypothetical protein